MKRRIKACQILKLFIVILITLNFCIGCFNGVKIVKKENAICIQDLKSPEMLDKNQVDETGFNANALIVQAKSIDIIEENVNVASAKCLAGDIYLVNFENQADTEEAYYEYKENSQITSVLKNYKAHVSDISAEKASVSGVSSGNEAWGVASTGMDKYINKLELANCDTEVKIAVLDTGISPNHEVFKNKVTADRIDMTCSRDYVNDDDYPEDDNGHGTAVAGVIAESTPANVKIVPVKVMDSEGLGDFQKIFNAISDLSTKVDIINLSLGTDMADISEDDLAIMENIIKSIVDNSGVIIVCAAGNSASSVEYPASSKYTLAASAIDSNNNLTDFSCYGDTVDFAMPGENVILPKYGTTNQYVYAKGTSIASPFLTSSIALVKAENPHYSKNQIIDLLKVNTKDLGATGKDIYYGYGTIDFNIDMFADNIEITAINRSNHSATIWFGNTKYSNDNSFSAKISDGLVAVICNEPCFVLYTKDNETTYEVLEGTAYSGYSNIYTYNFELVDGAKIIVVMKGDIDFNGIVNGNDAVEIKNMIRSGEAANLSILNEIIYNLDGVPNLNGNDVVVLKNVIKGTESFSW